MHDLPTQLVFGGALFYALVALCMGRYVSQHYTRLPGGKWTTLEKTQPTPRRESEQAA